MSDKPYISASQIGQFLFCPLSYYFIYIKKVFPRDPTNIYMAWGSAIHKALEVNYKQKIESKVDLPLEDVYKAFEDCFNKEMENASRPPAYVDVDSFYLIAENVLAKYLKEVAPTIMPLLVEYKFDIELKNYPIRILGYIDLVDTDIIIHDYKTVSKTTKKKWTQKAVDNSFQLTLYAVAVRQLLGKIEKGLCIDLIPRENKPEFKTITTQRTNEQIIPLLELATTIYEIKKLGVWYPNLNSCGDCPLKNKCPKRILSTESTQK